MQAESPQYIDILCGFSTVLTPPRFQFGQAMKPMWNDSDFELAATLGGLTDLCAIPALSKMSRHRFPQLFFHF
jgi:hypothetical protein